ncbi:MAG: hypothetical protein R3344_15355, partial [Acidobacteriota bacterium]|nr:hypothetical protein [Acidobacteriota bacterium]
MVLRSIYRHAFAAALATFAWGGVASGQIQHEWSQLLAGSEDSVVEAVATNDRGEIAVAGTFDEDVTIGNRVLNSAGHDDVFVA